MRVVKEKDVLGQEERGSEGCLMRVATYMFLRERFFLVEILIWIGTFEAQLN